ncbi:MAG: efflux RND transporter periplasmic adaptor subunit [Paramuribaculum sp.]|nr:efflux RND transporter periplasmic adaptor subunit [Paramuribaculum sp.]
MQTNFVKYAGSFMAGGVLLALASCGGKGQMAQMGGAPELGVMTVSLSNSESENSLPAQIKGKTDIAIRPQVTGFITKVHVDEGQHVKKGQPLFTLDQVTFQAAVDQAAAAVNSAQTAVSTAQRTADTKRSLLEKNIISEFEYQTAQDDLTRAKAALSQAQAGLVNAKKNLAYTVVTAPSDGVVGTIPNREGSLASPSSASPLTTISDNSQVYAYFSLTERDLLDMTEGGTRSVNDAVKAMPKVQLRLADGTVYPELGTVATVSGVIDNTTGAASVRALFDNPTGILRSGSTGRVIIPQDATDVIVIPQRATYELQDRRFVYVLGDSNKIASHPVEVVPVSDGQTFVVTSGLQPGDRIVVEGVGTANVRDGVTITPVDRSAASAAPQAAAAQQAQ